MEATVPERKLHTNTPDPFPRPRPGPNAAWAPTIPGGTRCETCVEQHRRQAKERAAQKREQASGQARIF